MHQHLAWLPVSCQHLLIWTSADLINEELGIAQECVCVIQWSESGRVPSSPLLWWWWTLTEMSSSLHPSGVKNGEWTCSGLLYGTCHCMPLIHFPRRRTQISANHLSVLACSDATSGEHQSSSLHSRLVFTVLDYRCQQEACTTKGSTKIEGYLACTLLCQQVHSAPHSFPQPNGIKMDLKFLAVPACIFLFEHMRARYSNVSSHFRLCRSLRNTSAASSSQQGISGTGRTILNLWLSLCDFPISGRHLPFGARQSGIWEGKVLLWPKAQQCVSFDQWVSFGSWVQAWPSTPTAHHCMVTASLLFSPPLSVLLFVDAFLLNVLWYILYVSSLCQSSTDF